MCVGGVGWGGDELAKTQVVPVGQGALEFQVSLMPPPCPPPPPWT